MAPQCDCKMYVFVCVYVDQSLTFFFAYCFPPYLFNNTELPFYSHIDNTILTEYVNVLHTHIKLLHTINVYSYINI